jgi:hypothetical protein
MRGETSGNRYHEQNKGVFHLYTSLRAAGRSNLFELLKDYFGLFCKPYSDACLISRKLSNEGAENPLW